MLKHKAPLTLGRFILFVKKEIKKSNETIKQENKKHYI